MHYNNGGFVKTYIIPKPRTASVISSITLHLLKRLIYAMCKAFILFQTQPHQVQQINGWPATANRSWIASQPARLYPLDHEIFDANQFTPP